jgi:putative transposase
VGTTGQRRRVVEHLKGERVSERLACRLVGFSRSPAWRPLKGQNDGELRARLKQLAERCPWYGYPTLHDMLRIEGPIRNPKRTCRIYGEESLQLRRKRRGKLTRPRLLMAVPTRVNERWSVDFVSDQLANGRRFRVFNVVDDFGRDCVAQIVDFSISGLRLARELDRISARRALPGRIVCDNVLYPESRNLGHERSGGRIFGGKRVARTTSPGDLPR